MRPGQCAASLDKHKQHNHKFVTFIFVTFKFVTFIFVTFIFVTFIFVTFIFVTSIFQDGLPGIFSSVAAQRDWIDEKIQSNGGGNFCDA